jgi:hypothetical protein
MARGDGVNTEGDLAAAPTAVSGLGGVKMGCPSPGAALRGSVAEKRITAIFAELV